MVNIGDEQVPEHVSYSSLIDWLSCGWMYYLSRIKQVKESYREESNLLLKNLKMKCLQYKIDFVEADINEGFHPILQKYLVKRSKMKVG